MIYTPAGSYNERGAAGGGAPAPLYSPVTIQIVRDSTERARVRACALLCTTATCCAEVIKQPIASCSRRGNVATNKGYVPSREERYLQLK